METGDGPGAMGDGPGDAAIGLGDGDGPGAIMTTGDGLGMGGGMTIGLGAIITGIAEEAGDASMTLGGAGLGDASPTPIRAKFELSNSRGHGFRVKYETLR
jgi:hypothetical protein